MLRESSGYLGTPNLVSDVKDNLSGKMMSKLSLDLGNMWKSMDRMTVCGAGQRRTIYTRQSMHKGECNSVTLKSLHKATLQNKISLKILHKSEHNY